MRIQKRKKKKKRRNKVRGRKERIEKSRGS